MKKLIRKIVQFTITGWGILLVSAISLILGLIAAGSGKWNGLAFVVWFMGFMLWTILMNNGYFGKEDEL